MSSTRLSSFISVMFSVTLFTLQNGSSAPSPMSTRRSSCSRPIVNEIEGAVHFLMHAQKFEVRCGVGNQIVLPNGELGSDRIGGPRREEFFVAFLHEGEYKCKCGDINSSSTLLTSKPTFETVITTSLGASVNLPCHVEIHHSLRKDMCIEWRVRPLGGIWRSVNFTEERFNLGAEGRNLIIQDVQKDDLSVYRCRVKSVSGQTFKGDFPAAQPIRLQESEMNVIGTIEESHGMCLNVVRPGGHLETHCKSAGPIEVKEGDGTLYKCFMKQTGGQCQ